MKKLTLTFILMCAAGIVLSAESKSPRIKRDFFAFDNGMNLLDEIGYTGPIGLQCYNIKGNDRANLKKSADAWKALNQ